MKKELPYRLIISGGGTGGHIFPALAIANAFRERHPESQILFVGAEGRMEMTRVPEAGYKIIGLWISGIQRKLTLSNLLFPIKLLVSYVRATMIIKKYKPQAVIGTGGYASGPIILAATRLRVPSLVQEQNSYAGITNKRAGKRASKICVAYEGMEKYFPKNKIVFTGNPVRKNILTKVNREDALNKYGFETGKKTLLVIGGSLGARTINESILKGIEKIVDAQVQLIWQTGKYYYADYKTKLQHYDLRKVRLYDFVNEMHLALAAADLVISRAGALAVSELCVVKKPCILVPSPNVAEDHQTRNAEALVQKGAAHMVADKDAVKNLVNDAIALLFNQGKLDKLSQNISMLSKPDAAEDIVDEIEKLIGISPAPSKEESHLNAILIC